MNRSFLSKIALLLILFSTSFYVSAHEMVNSDPTEFLQAQDPLRIKVTINVKNVTATTFFNELKKSCEGKISFVYAESDFSNIKDITIAVTNETVEEVLKKLTTAHPSLRYSVENNIITVKRGVTPTQRTPQTNRAIYTGQVVDEQRKAVEGATILLKGTSTGAISDGKGNFTLTAAPGQEIDVSCVGKISKTVTLGDPKATLNIALKTDALAIDEVQVIAYGTTTKRETTGSMTTIKADDIKGIPSSSVSNLLQGRVAGMDVTNITGAPGGGGTQVTIRGYNSLSIESGRRFSNPLWVIDGIPMNTFTSPVTGTNGLADLNPETIETIQVLKDASATSLYGSRAANGVILVTTKKGYKNQDAQFSVNVSQSFGFLPETPTVYGGRGERNHRLAALRNLRESFYDYDLNEWRYTNSYEDAYENGYDYDHYWGYGKGGANDGDELQDSLNSFYNNSTDFFKYYFQTGKTTNANIQTYGGSERMTYSIGGGYYGEDGILKGSAFDRVNVMGNFSVLPTKFLTVDFRTALTYSDRSRGSRKSSRFGGASEIETIPGDPFNLSTLYPGNSEVVNKAIYELNSTREKNNSFRLRTSFGLKVDILKNLNISNTTSLEYAQNNRNFFSPSTLNELKHSSSTGEISRDMMLLNETVINYGLRLNSGHNFEVMLGHSYQHDTYNYNAGLAMNGPSDLVYYATELGWPSLYIDANGNPKALQNYESDFSEKKMASLFGRLNYNYKQKYIATVTLRYDGSSVFGSNVRWATFPSFAAAWNFSEESFMKGAKFINFGKIRASYGWSGNQFNNPYLAYGILSGSRPFNGAPTIAPNWGDGYYNPDLTWEETKQLDVGIDLSMAKNRLNVTVDYYNRITDKMLLKSGNQGNHNGYVSMWRNGAALSNDGIEFEVKYDIFNNDKAYWNISLNFAKNWNKFYKSYNNRDISATSIDNQSTSYILGKSVGEIRGYKTNGYYQNYNDVIYNWSEDGKYTPIMDDGQFGPGHYNYVDTNGDGAISYKDAVYLGSSIPTLYGGILTEAKYKNFDINLLFSYSLGRDMAYIGATGSISTLLAEGKPIFENLDKVSFWEKEGDNSTYPINAMGVSVSIMDRMVQKVNYIKLKTLTLGYTIPSRITKKIYLNEVRAFFSAENLFTITNYKGGLDPETVDINTGIDKGDTYPLARKFTIGLTVKF